LPGRDAIDELDAADLHDPMPLERVESRRLRIEHDFAHVYIPAVAATESLSPLRHCSNRVKDRTHLGARRFKATRSVHDKIRPTLLLVIRHLLREDRVEFVYGHAWPFGRARPLPLGRRESHPHRITPALTAGFEQERDVEHRNLLVPRLGFSQQPPLPLLHERMNDRLEPFQRCNITEDTRRQLIAIDLATYGCPAKRRCDRRSGRP